MSGLPQALPLSLPPQPDYPQALRYLAADPADGETLALLERCRGLLAPAARPWGVWAALEQPGELAQLAAPQNGRDLQRHLEYCTGAALMAVTLGSRVDSLLRRLSATDLPAAVAADALASVLVDQVCDTLEQQLREWYRARGLYLTGRYSPGYGDCPIALQGTLCRRLDTARRIGLTLTQEALLLPRKSVTAILGVSPQPVTGWRAGCAHCVLKETCAYRKRGTNCAN